MGHTFHHIALHVIFSTHDKRPDLPPAIRPELNRYLVGIARNHDVGVAAVNCVADHVHILVRISPTSAAADILRDLKANASAWLKTRDGIPADFAWQRGYSVFSVSESAMADVIAYIDRQEEHHRTVTFQDELEAFLRRHHLDWHPNDLP